MCISMFDVGRLFFVVEEATATSRISTLKGSFALANLYAGSQETQCLNFDNHDLWFLIYLFHNYTIRC